MRIGRREWCFRTPPKPKRLSSSNGNNYYMTKKSLTKSHYTFHVPGAPLNTTSYLIQTKEELTYHHHEYRPSDSPVLDVYGSMKGLIGLSSSLSFLLNETTNGADDSSSSSKRVRNRSKDPEPRLLSLRIMHRDDEIANLEEESMTMKERVSYLEKEINQMKHRVKILEVANHDAMPRTVVMIKTYCNDAVSVV